MSPDSAPDARLPALAREYLGRALPSPDTTAQQIRITQTGEMWMKPGGRAMRFTATEWLAVSRVGFEWRARLRIVPLVSLVVLDGYAPGAGILRVSALGVPLQTRTGPELDVGEVYRYLAELPWVPQAIAANAELEWAQLEERTVEVATSLPGARPAMRLEFDDSGDVVRCFAPARPRDSRGGAVPTPWGGEFGGYGMLGGMRMPARAEVYWELPEGRFVYWRGQITSAEALETPFEPTWVSRP